MSYFEYLAIYIGIVVGLAISNILSSIHKLVEAGARVRWHWAAPASAAYAALITLGVFWSLWARQTDMGHNSFLASLPTFIAMGLLFLTCAAALPDEVPENGFDLEKYYFDNRYRFWGFSTAMHVLNLASWCSRLAETGFDTSAVQHALIPIAGNSAEAAISVTLIFVRASWAHAIGLAILSLYAVLYFGPLSLH